MYVHLIRSYCNKWSVRDTVAILRRSCLRSGYTLLSTKQLSSNHGLRCGQYVRTALQCRANPEARVWMARRLLGRSGLVIGVLSCRAAFVRVACDTASRDGVADVENRLEEMSGNVENMASFDWAKFWKLIIPDFFLLLGAIAVEVKAPALRLVYVYVVQGLLTFAYVSLLSCVGERVACRLRRDLFEAIVRQDVAFFDAHKSGELISRLTADIQDFKSSFKLCISQGLRSLAQTVGCFVSLYTVSPQMTSLLAVTLPVVVMAGSFLGSFLRKLSRFAADQSSKATSVASEAIGNIRTVRAFAMESKEIEMYGREVDRAGRLSEYLGIGIGAFQGVTNIALNGIVLGVMFVGGYMMSVHSLSAGDLMSFLVATQTIQRSLAQLSLLFGQYVKGLSAGARVFEYTNVQPSIPLKGGEKIPFHTLHGDLEFRNVTFAYPTRPGQIVLRNFDLRIPAGRVVALCGPSGGGKSTIASLLERFYDVNEGFILIDGHDLRTLDASWLRGKVIGFINQEPVLFAMSVMENIRYGKPDATDQEVMEAAIVANADEFIRKFPNGYQTVVGERGVAVSGGQKQRIAIARALIKNPAIVILDEATSALDAESEKQVQEALDRVVKGRTVLVIAHRLSTIQNADVIVVLSGGVVAEMGTHASLKKLRGLYWDMIDQQQKEVRLHEGRQGTDTL